MACSEVDGSGTKSDKEASERVGRDGEKDSKVSRETGGRAN